MDRSGSMSGQPLHEALRCAEYIAGGLQKTDRSAAVLCDDTVHIPLPLRPAGNAEACRKALAGVESGGSTALFDGWQAGANLLEGKTAGTISRVLLLSDSQAHHGLCDEQEIRRHCARRAAQGVSTNGRRHELLRPNG
ncbi:vWA domain-containing protein [Ramlibacter aurantiacus]